MKLPTLIRSVLPLFLSIIFTLPSLPHFAIAREVPNESGFLDVYRIVSPEKSLQTSPAFIVVDDFNSGKFSTQKGAAWQIKSPEIGALDLGLKKEDARNPKRGYSLNAQFNLMKNERASFQSFLNLLDVSQAQYLIFKIRLNLANGNPFTGKIQLALTDWRHETAVHDLSDQLTKHVREWQDILIPTKVFEPLDLDSLFAVKFVIVSGKKPLKGKLAIDEIAFFGFNDVGFESNRDNLAGFPKIIYDHKRRKKIQARRKDRKLLKEIARDTWKYFENARDKKTHLVVDHIRMGDAPLAASYTSPTNIAMDLIGTIAAMDLHFISKREAANKVKKILKTLEKMRKFKGFFYNFYDTKRLAITRQYISSVDNGWLAIALVVVRQAFEGKIAKQATGILDAFNFDEFIDPENRQMVIGFDVPVRNFGGYHYGMLISEARATSLYAIGKGDVSKEHWWFLYRTPPEAWEWQNQKPQGKWKEQDGVHYFQGYYETMEKQFVPSWGGSLFEVLMPTLVLKERELAPNSFGLNNKRTTEIHRDYALHVKQYPVWGLSPAAITNGRQWHYREYGVKALSVKGYPDREILTPHVSFLALDCLPKDAIKNIREWIKIEAYGEYGLYDTLNARSGKVNPQYLALDQGMILVALGNYLTKGAIQERFHKDSVGKNIEKLWLKESFFNH